MKTIRADAVQRIETPGGNASSPLATPSLGAAEVSVVRQRQSPGGFNPLHTQSREEVMVLLSGRVTVSGPEEHVVLEAGDTLIVPAHTPHRIDNTGSSDAEWLIVSAAGMQFFREGGEPVVPAWLR